MCVVGEARMANALQFWIPIAVGIPVVVIVYFATRK